MTGRWKGIAMPSTCLDGPCQVKEVSSNYETGMKNRNFPWDSRKKGAEGIKRGGDFE